MSSTAHKRSQRKVLGMEFGQSTTRVATSLDTVIATALSRKAEQEGIEMSELIQQILLAATLDHFACAFPPKQEQSQIRCIDDDVLSNRTAISGSCEAWVSGTLHFRRP